MKRYNLRKKIIPSLKAQEANLKLVRQPKDMSNIEDEMDNDNLGINNLYEAEGEDCQSVNDGVRPSSPNQSQLNNIERMLMVVLQNQQEIVQKQQEMVQKQQVMSNEIGQLRSDMFTLRREITREIKQVETKFDDQINELREEINAQIVKAKEKLNTDLQEKMKVSSVEKPIGLQQVIYPIIQTKELPKFDGKNRNPNEFLYKLKNYFTKENERRTMRNEELLQLEDILEGCLVGASAKWWSMIRPSVQNIDDFERVFLNKYWNEEIQDGIKRKLDLERYLPRKGLTRAEYFIERVVLLQNMTPKCTEREIVRRLVRHFNDTIQQACKVQNINTIQQMEELLNKEDTEETNESIRNESERNNRREFHEHKPYRERNHDDRRGHFERRNYNDNNRDDVRRYDRYDRNKDNWRSMPRNQNRGGNSEQQRLNEEALEMR